MKGDFKINYKLFKQVTTINAFTMIMWNGGGMHVIRITAAALVVLILLTACHKETEQDRVKKVVTEIRTAAGEKDIKTILRHLSKTYHDPQGYDYDGIKGLLLYYFFKHQTVSVFIPSLDITVVGSSAKAVFQAVLSGGNKVESPGDLIPEALGMYDFDVSFAKESGEWKVTSAMWKKGGAENAGRQSAVLMH
jgi:hypothetical protein